MRLLLLAPFVLLAACGSGETSNLQGNGAAAPPPGQPDNRIDCRPAGAPRTERACTLETVETAQGRVLTIRKADGGFRRLLISRDGHISAADGAEPARFSRRAVGTYVEIGGDRFLLPAGM